MFAFASTWGILEAWHASTSAVSGGSSGISAIRRRCRFGSWPRPLTSPIPYLSQVERGLRKPSAEILNRIAQGLRISAETLYVQAGILDQRDGDESVTTAIASDLTLSERQRTTLLQIYAAFQSENRAQAERVAADNENAQTAADPSTGTATTENQPEPADDQPRADREEQR